MKRIFNSSMVRLRVKLSDMLRVELTLFQFQYGAIKAELPLSEAIPLILRFQFSMVRIKEKVFRVICFGFLVNFKFSMLRLRESN